MSEKDGIDISFVILTWNSKKFAEKCLNSIKSSAKTHQYEVIIIDNGSSDNTLELANSTLPDAVIILNDRNRGVAPARNQGLAAAKGQYVVILDIDTYLEDQAINELVDYMDKNERVGICVPRLMYEDGMVQESARRFPTAITKVLRRVETKWSKSKLEQGFYNLNQIKEPIKVDYAIGACQVIRKKALEEVGLLDENIFYGPEDVDLCLRMWLEGWEVVYYPHSQVVHYEQRITKKKLFSRITFEHIKGLIYYFIKHRYFFSRKKLYRRISKSSKI